MDCFFHHVTLGAASCSRLCHNNIEDQPRPPLRVPDRSLPANTPPHRTDR
ncbi:uncharacterized, partial [Tachysurus ichikawai]